MDGGREDIICGLRLVDVVVGMNRILAPHLTPEHLNCPICDDFIDVHIRLCAAACLPDTEWKMVI